jgi:hypothetical protein
MESQNKHGSPVLCFAGSSIILLLIPLMKIFGHDPGGIITNSLLTVLTFLSFALCALRTSGEAGAMAGLWLLAAYPGITYYAGQPFLYALIVPGCLWLSLLLWQGGFFNDILAFLYAHCSANHENELDRMRQTAVGVLPII